MDVAGKMEEVGVGFDENGFIFSLKKWTKAAVFFIEVADIAIRKAAHELGNASFSELFDQEMKVVRHEDESDKFDLFMQVRPAERMFLTRIGGNEVIFEIIKKSFIIVAVKENWFFVNTAVVKVVKSLFDVNFKGVFCRHVSSLSFTGRTCQIGLWGGRFCRSDLRVTGSEDRGSSRSC